jgi:hypothetical protein
MNVLWVAELIHSSSAYISSLCITFHFLSLLQGKNERIKNQDLQSVIKSFLITYRWLRPFCIRVHVARSVTCQLQNVCLYTEGLLIVFN